jgi:uncharacterized membrane protein
MTNRTWLIAILIVSIGLNLLFAGVVIGRHLGAGPTPHFGWMMQEIEPETRKRLRSSMREHREATRPAQQALREAQHRLHQTIAADPFAEEDVQRALANLRRNSTGLQETMHQQMLTTLSQLEPEERIKVFQALSNRMMRPPHGPNRPHPIERND